MKMKKTLSLLLALCIALSFLVLPASAASDMVYSQNTNINTPFNGFDNVTVKANVKVAIGSGGGLEVRKNLTVEEGGSIVGANSSSVLLFRGGSSSSGITFYYDHEGVVKELPYGVQRLWEVGYSTDTPANFLWQDGKWVLEGVINGGDSFTTEEPVNPETLNPPPPTPEEDAAAAASAHKDNIELAKNSADRLNQLGLFKGVGTNPNGTTNYDLERDPKRVEAMVMLIRLLGQEGAAVNGSWAHPFTDVPAWADKYVGYAYEKGLTKGISATLFGSEDKASAVQYLTFVLRAMGYSDAGGADFTWDQPHELAMKAGFLTGDVDVDTLWRADMAILSFNALHGRCKDGRELKDKLIADGVFSAGDYAAVSDCPQQPGEGRPTDQMWDDDGGIRWDELPPYDFTAFSDNTYKAADYNVTAPLKNGMSSDLRLLANDVGVAEEKYYDHNNGLAYVRFEGYNYYLVADTWNNRVLIYRTQGTAAWDKNTPIYRILGQSSAATNAGGYGLNQLNYPVGVTAGVDAAGKLHIYVADANNNRILVWDGMPSQNGQAAAYDVCYLADPASHKNFPNAQEARMAWPWAVWTDGTTLICTATSSGNVAIWDQLPTKADKYPDKVLHTGGTPRTISSDGKGYLILSDHNIQGAQGVFQGCRVFKNYNSLFTGGKTYVSNGGDILYKDLYGNGMFLTKPLTTSDGNQLPAGALLMTVNNCIYVWRDGRIDSASDQPDYRVGGGSDGIKTEFKFTFSDFNTIIVDDAGNLYTPIYNESKVVGYSAGKFPAEPATVTVEDMDVRSESFVERKKGTSVYQYDRNDGVIRKFARVTPDLFIGQDSVDRDSDVARFMVQNCSVDTDGHYFVAAGDFKRCLMLWETVPGESGARPDAMYQFPNSDPINTAALFTWQGKTGVLAGGQHSLYVWYDVKDALAGKAHDLHYNEKIGSADMGSMMYDFDFDGQYLYVLAETGLYLFEGFPKASDAPKAKLNDTGADGTVRATTLNDGRTLFTVARNGLSFTIYDRAKVLSGTKTGDTVSKVSGAGSITTFDGLWNAIITPDGHVLASDMNHRRILAWKSVSDAVGGKNVSVVLGLGAGSYTEKDAGGVLDYPVALQSAATLANPKYLCYDGQYLWVGDFKFSGGIRRFSGLLG